MKYYLKSKEALPEGLHRIVRKLLDKSNNILIDQNIDPDIAVHGVRKASKKLRALLRLLAPALPRKTFRSNNRALRDYARLLGGARDSAVRLSSLEHLQTHFAGLLDKSATAPVHQELSRLHHLATQKHLDQLSTPDSLRRLQEIHTQLAAIDLSGITLDSLIAGLAESYRCGRRAFKALYDEPTTDHSHALRKYTKTLWYQLRLLQKWNPKVLLPLIEQLDALGELLGHDHDLATLNESLETLPACRDDPLRSELLNSLIEARRVALLSQSLRSAEQVYRRKPRKFIAWFESIQTQSC